MELLKEMGVTPTLQLGSRWRGHCYCLNPPVRGDFDCVAMSGEVDPCTAAGSREKVKERLSKEAGFKQLITTSVVLKLRC